MDSLIHIQGPSVLPVAHFSQPAPLFLIHAVSGFGLPYLSLGPLSPFLNPQSDTPSRPIYALSSPLYQYKSYTPSQTFAALAQEYVDRIRTVRPHGPYILGGWSMGGVLAVKMTEILQQGGEEVFRVVLIDSASPEGCPQFADAKEKERAVQWLYGIYAPRLGLLKWEQVADGGEGEDEGSSDGDTEDEDEEDVDIALYLPRLRAHISNALTILGNAGQGPYLDHDLECPVSLIKCTKLAPLPPATAPERKAAIEYRHHDVTNGWGFKDLQWVEMEAEHDQCFDPDNLPLVTEVLRGVMEDLD